MSIAQENFKKALLEDSVNEAKKSALAAIGPDSPSLLSRLQKGGNRLLGNISPTTNRSKLSKDSEDAEIINIASTREGTARGGTLSSERAPLDLSQ